MGTYNSAVLADSPVRYWKLDDSTGTDTKGNGNLTKGTSGAAPTTGVTGQSSIGSAWSFDGTDEATFTTPTITTSFTFECFFKTSASGGGSHTIFRSDNGADVAVIRVQGASNGTNPGKILCLFGTTPLFYSSGTVNDNNWHHLALTLSGTTAKLYIDGTQVGSATTDRSSYSFNTTSYLGRPTDGTSTEYYNGSLDEVAIYNTALSSTQIAAHYAARAGTYDGYDAQAMTASATAPTVYFAGPERYTNDLTTYTSGEWTFGSGVTPSHASGKLTLTKGSGGVYSTWNLPNDAPGDFDALMRVKNTGSGTARVLVAGISTAAYSTVPADGLWYWARVYRVGGEVRYRIWENSATEPTSYGTASTGTGALSADPKFYTDNTSLVIDYMVVDVKGNSVAIPTLPAENVSVTADAVTGSATAPDATVNIWAGYNPEPLTGSGELVMPPIDLTYYHSPAFGSGEMGDAAFAADANAIITVDAASAEGNLLDPDEVSDLGDPYYLELLATIDTDDFWYRLDEQSGTVIHDALGTAAKDADLFGDYSFGVYGPESRRAIKFTDGYAKRRWATESSTTQGQSPIDDSDTDQFAFEVVLRTTDGNGIIAYGLDRANPTIETGPVPYFRNSIYLKEGKVSTNWNYAGRTDSAYELSGVTNVADGQWHHIVVAFNYGPTNNLNSGLRIYVDGKLDIRRRRDVVPGLWASPDSYFGMPEAWRAVTPLYGWQKNFNGDVMEVAFRYNDFLTHDDVIELYYAAFGIVPVRVAPATATGVMPDAIGKGNQKKALVLYTKWSAQGLFSRIGDERNAPSSYSGTVPDEFDHALDLGRVFEPGEAGYIDMAGYRVYGMPIMREDYEVLAGPYRDPITDLPRLINLQEDIDLDGYDLIVFRNWPDEGADREVFYQRGYTDDSIRDFLASVKQAVVDGKSLEVTNVSLASELGLISGAKAIPMFYDRNGFDDRDARTVAISPFDESGDPNVYLDMHANQWHRVVASVENLTDIEGSESITEAYSTYNSGTNGDVNNKWGYKLTDGPLSIGDELLSPAVFWNKIFSYTDDGPVTLRPWNNYLWAITPDGLNVGTPVYRFASNYYVDNTAVANPYADYIGGAIVQPGDNWGGVIVGGKVFINFGEAPIQALNIGVMDRQIVPPNDEIDNPLDHETTEQREWDYSYDRVAFTGSGGLGSDQKVTIKQQADGSYSLVSEDKGGDLVGINIIEKYPLEQVIVPTWALRGLAWLAVQDEVAAGSVVVRAAAMTGSASAQGSQTVAERSVTVSTAPAVAQGVLVAPDEASEPDAIIYTFPAEGSGVMTGYGKTLAVEPMTGNADLVDNFDLISASGEQVTLYLHGLQEVELYLMEGIK